MKQRHCSTYRGYRRNALRSYFCFALKAERQMLGLTRREHDKLRRGKANQFAEEV